MSVLRYCLKQASLQKIANFGLIRLKLPELEDNNTEAKQLRAKKLLEN